MSDSQEQVTKLLQAIDRGEHGAAEELLPLVYDELRSRAGKLIAGERRDHTLQRTALVHEAYLKLAGANLNFQSRAHFSTRRPWQCAGFSSTTPSGDARSNEAAGMHASG